MDENKGKAKRGQNKKLKKLKKYEDQDEEEQAMKLKLLGTTKMEIMKKNSQQQP